MSIMKKYLGVVFFGVSAIVLAFLLYFSVADEITKRKKIETIESLIKGRLDSLKMMQMAYKDMKGDYADNFDDLFNFMKNGKIAKLKQVGDVDGEVVNVKQDTIFVNPILELFKNENVKIDHMKFVPPYDTAKFKIASGRIIKNNVSVPVFEIEDPHPVSDLTLKIGDINDAVTTGNWK